MIHMLWYRTIRYDLIKNLVSPFDNVIKIMGRILESYFEQSISAYKLVNQVTRSMKIDEPPEISVQNGNVEKIILECTRIIEENYQDKRVRELLKYYVAHSFFEDYDIENDEDYSDELLNWYFKWYMLRQCL